MTAIGGGGWPFFGVMREVVGSLEDSMDKQSLYTKH